MNELSIFFGSEEVTDFIGGLFCCIVDGFFACFDQLIGGLGSSIGDIDQPLL